MRKRISFEELIKKINDLDYLGGPSYLRFKVNNLFCEAIIEDDENYCDTFVLYINGIEIWRIDPDWMELYDTIRRITTYCHCEDNSKYYLLVYK